MTTRISNSEIQTFKDDRRVWYLKYYRCLAPRGADVSGPKELGTRVHYALQQAYAKECSPKQVINDMYREIDREGLSEYQVNALDKEHKLANVMLTGFVEWMAENAIDADLEVIDTETAVEVKSPVPDVTWRGILDQRIIRRSSGARLFRDWKTVQSLKDPIRLLQHDEQMKMYHLLEMLHEMQTTGHEPRWRTEGALYFMLRKCLQTARANPPFYAQHEIRHSKTEIESFYMQLVKVTREIAMTREALDRGGDVRYYCPPRPSRDWTWKNEFLPVMSLMDDESDWEGFLSEYYEKIDPDARYESAPEIEG